ncbi:hypothetical protein PM082_014282 [Marasmius tenuissimus]|nr:hypothetical protein PM082_014282 [Marasmius tenuissimus]
MHTIYFTLLPYLHIALATPVAPELTISNPFSLVTQDTTIIEWSGGIPPYTIVLNSFEPEGGAGSDISTALTLDNLETSPMAWTVDVLPGRSVVIELRDSSGLATKTHLIPAQSPKSNAVEAGPTRSPMHARALARRELTEPQSIGLGIGIVAGILILGMIVDCVKRIFSYGCSNSSAGSGCYGGGDGCDDSGSDGDGGGAGDGGD